MYQQNKIPQKSENIIDSDLNLHLIIQKPINIFSTEFHNFFHSYPEIVLHILIYAENVVFDSRISTMSIATMKFPQKSKKISMKGSHLILINPNKLYSSPFFSSLIGKPFTIIHDSVDVEIFEKKSWNCQKARK